jgi:hypothetical protein
MEINMLPSSIATTGNPYWRGRINTMDLLVLTFLEQVFFITNFFRKQATLTRRSTLLTLLMVTLIWCHDIQHNDTCQNNIAQNGIMQKCFDKLTLSPMALCRTKLNRMTTGIKILDRMTFSRTTIIRMTNSKRTFDRMTLIRTT